MQVTSIQPTPNPNAFKFLTDQALAGQGKTKAYAEAEQAQGDTLAEQIFAIAGIETLFFCDNFITVSMTPDADWRAVAEQVTKILEAHEGTAVEAGPATGPATGSAAPDPLEDIPKGGDPEVLSKINALLDDRVRPALAGDGGGLQVIGLEGKTLYIRYEGACGSCPSSTSGTLVAIQNLLQSEVDEDLVVTMS